MYSIYISKADKVLSVDFDSLPEVSKRFIIEYGLKQKLNDAGSSATVKELGPNEAAKQAFALAEASLQALASGQISVRVAKPQESLEEREYKKLLRSMLKKAFPPSQEKIEVRKGLHPRKVLRFLLFFPFFCFPPFWPALFSARKNLAGYLLSVREYSRLPRIPHFFQQCWH